MQPKFPPKTMVRWQGYKAEVLQSWFDGVEMRCEIFVLKAPDIRGYWTVKESSLDPILN